VTADDHAAARLVYLYGFTAREVAEAAAMEDVEGIAPARPIRLVAGNGIAAVVSDVPADEFSRDALARNLNELPWLEATARSHTRVLSHLLSRGAVLPARLPTVYRSDDQVREVLVREHEVLARALDRLRGVREWGIKVSVDGLRLVRVIEQELEDAPRAKAAGESSGGAAYLARRQREKTVEERARREVSARARDAHEFLRGAAVDARVVAARAELPGGHAGDVVLSGAYLVARDREEEFHRAVADLRRLFEDRGLVIVASGPWPPYNFVEEASGE
jgi:hypothetical protein